MRTALRTSSLPACFLGCLISVASLEADDWPQWLGPDRNGVSKETGWSKKWSPLPTLWKKKIGSGYSSIVVAKGRLILFHRIGDELRVDSLDPMTGDLQWKFSYPTTYVDRYRYDSGPRCCPTIYEGRVYTLDPDGVLHALNLTTGEKLWGHEIKSEHRLKQNFFGTGATPIVENGVLYAHLGGPERKLGTGYTFAFDAKTGGLLWKTPTYGGSYASPSVARVDAVDHLFIFHRGGMLCLDPKKGEKRWNYVWHSRQYESVNAATPLVVGDILFFSATYRTGSVCLRIKKDSYEELWKDDPQSREKIMDIHWTPPNYLDGYVYGFSGRHPQGSALKCVELKTGDVKWSWPSYLCRGSMIFSDGHFIAMGEYGDLALLRLSPAGARELVKIPNLLKHPAWTVPTLANGLLYLRDRENLICLDLRGDEKKSRNEQPSD